MRIPYRKFNRFMYHSIRKCQSVLKVIVKDGFILYEKYIVGMYLVVGMG